MRILLFASFFLCSFTALSQADLKKIFKNCHVQGSTTIYDFNKKLWYYTDSSDAFEEMLPASTFKVINLLIALETGIIKDEHDTIKWVGGIDTSLYGYRPEIYKDMSVKEAFEVSAGWVFIELAKRVGKHRYQYYLNLSKYGNGKLSQKGDDFWNFGDFAISPQNQVKFLVDIFQEKAHFSKRNLQILKSVMITEKIGSTVIRSKTGWTRVNGMDIGWWIGYVERRGGVYFFATRLTKDRSIINHRFGQCRKEITKEILRQLKMLD